LSKDHFWHIPTFSRLDNRYKFSEGWQFTQAW
jgi:hypothetical protein